MAYEALAKNFKNGDVIYGLDAPRAEALRELKENHGVQRDKPVTKVYCCGLFNSSVMKKNIVIQNDITNAVWNPSSPTVYSNDKQIHNTLVDGNRGVRFKQFLQNHSKYNVAARPDNTTSDLSKKAQNAWQRTSKAGLEFHAKSSGTVHFIITGLDIGAVVSKQGYGESITSAELRWLYRHKDVDDVRHHVKFYDKDGELSHEDVFSNPAWASYQPKHTYDADWQVVRMSTMINMVKN